MNLKSILSEMQLIDPNSEWLQGLEDIENGEETTEGLIECMNIALRVWRDEEVEVDSFEYWHVQRLIVDLWFLNYDRLKGEC